MKIKSKIKRILSGVMAVCMSLTVTSGVLPERIFGADTFATVASAAGYELTAEECIEQNGSHHFKMDSCDYDAGMQRFQLQKHCTRCGFDQMDYHTARYLVQPYVGYYDGEEHGIYFVLPTDPAGGENDDRSNKVGLGGYGINGKAPSGQFYKSNPSDAFSEEPIMVSESGYTPVIWKVWFKLDVSRCVDEYDTYMCPEGWVNGYAEGASYILILSNEDDNAPGTGGGTGGGSGGGTGGSSGGSGGSVSSTSTLEQLHNEGTHTEDMYHFHHTEPATCERDGFDVFECRFCGKTISRNIYPKVGHSYDTYIVKEATCEDEGIIAHECTWCRDTNTETIPATGHSYKATVTPATCKTGLQITKYTCTKCGDQYEDSEIVDVPHTWETETIKADCTTAGEIHYHCKVCDTSYVEQTSDALGHDWDEGHEFSAADGTNPAKWEYTCTRCGVKRYADAASVSGCLAGQHTYEAVETVNPTCTDLGYEWWECSSCGKREKRNYSPATKHDYREEIKIEPTCTSQGSVTYKCFNCGDTYTETKPKLAHELVSVTTPATCQSPSVTVTKCENCKYTVRTEGTEKGNHIWRTEVDAATCTDEGIIKTVCEVCGKEQTQESSEALGHDWDDGHVIEAGTCTTPATIELYCNRCPEIKKLSASELTSSALFSSTSAAGGHNPGKPATCTEPQTCDDCGIVLNVATGHSYGEGVVIKEATCTQMGIMKYTCDKCGASYEVNIPTTGKHTPGDEATCTTPQKCKDCGAILVEKLGHDWNEGTDISSATCGASGVKEYTCRRCHATEKRNTNTTTVGHRAGAAATCTTPQTCLECGAVLAPATEHSWGSPVTLVKATCSSAGLVQYQCTKCGATRQENTPADASLHKRGASATCTSPQKCTECGVVLELPTGHSFNSGSVVIPATCTANAVIEYKCTGCGLTQREILADSAKGHTPGKAATCEEAQKCKDCGVVLEDKTDHIYREVVTNPTCTEMGYTTYTCTVCGESHKGNYTDTLPHNYVEKVTEPTCTDYGYTTYTCHDCKDSYVSNYTKPKPHDYVAQITPPTCTELGFTTYTCRDCEATYKSDYVETTEHNYQKQVIPPTCEELGYTIYTCPDCGKEYMGDYEKVADHNFEANVIPPTCTESGYTVYTCKDCEYSYKSDYTDPKGHDYKKEITPPTCTDMGYTTFTCNVCGYTEQGEYVNETGHKYVEKVTEPTCSEMGYTTFTCSVCGDSYVGNEVMPLPHDYTEKVTPPTCEDLGYTTYTCSKCGDTYDGNYIEATDHILSGWIIDTPATIESAGEKHIECTVCGKVLHRAAIPQLVDIDNSDEDGKSTVGDYSIIITDKNGKPVFDSEIAIDTADNITIKLPEGRLLDYEDRTTITVTRTDTKEAVPGLQLFVSDANGNSSIGETDGNGQLVVPNGNSSTGNNNGTVGGGDTENSFTYVVTVTDKNNMVIPNCVVSVGENNGISVKLPYDVPMDYSNRITVTVTDQHRNGLNGIPVSVIGKDKTESGVTNVYGRLTVPNGNQDYTDSDGHANVNAYVVTVNDETKPLENASVTYTEGANILVTLPETNSITFENRVTVTVLTKDGKPVRNMNVAVSDFMGNNRSGITDENGQIVVPPLNEDITDTDGNAAVDDLTVTVEDENAKIANALVTHADGKVLVSLPEANKISYENRITVTVLKGDEPVVGKAVIVSDTANNSDKGITNTQGKVVIPPLDDDYTDEIGTARVNKYIVTVNDEKGFIENALVKFADEKISVTLPDTNTLATSNQTTVTVTDKDAKAVKDMSVTVTDKNSKTETKLTDANGKITVPTKTSSGGGGGGSSSGGGSHGSGGGGGSTVTVTYNVKVTDKDGKSVSVTKSVKDSKITLTLPSGKTLDNNYYTIVVTDKNNKPAPDIDITLKDKNGKTANGVTDANGKLVLPAVEHKAYVSGYEDGSFRPDGNMTRAEAAAIFARNISDRKGESILNKKTAFVDVDTNAWYNSFVSYLESYNIIVGYDDGSFRPDAQITRAEFVTMCMRFYGMFDTVKTSAKNIFADVPASHWAASNICNAIAMNWIVGYADGTFKPDSNITRAEVVTIVNRVTERAADTEYVNKNLSTLNRFTDLTDKGYWAYYEITEAANTHMAVDKANGETWVK